MRLSLRSVFLNSNAAFFLIASNFVFAFLFVPEFIERSSLSEFGEVAVYLQVSAGGLLIFSALTGALNRVFSRSYYSGQIDDSYCSVLATFYYISFAFIFLGLSATFLLIISEEFLFDYVLMYLSTYFMISTLIFFSPKFSENKLFYISLTQGFTILFRMLICFALLSFLEPVVSFVLSVFVCSFLGLMFSVWVFFRGASEIRGFRSQTVLNFSNFHPVLDTGRWLLVNSVGAFLVRNIDLSILMFFYGSELTGEYGVYLQLLTLVRLFSEALSSSLAPKFMQLSVSAESENAFEFVKRSSVIVGFVVLVFSLLVFFNLSYIFHIWLNNSITPDLLTSGLLVGSVALSGCAYPFIYFQTANGLVKTPSIVSLVIGIIYVLTISMLSYSSASLSSVALTLMVALIVKNLVCIPLLSCISMGWRFFDVICIYIKLISFGAICCIIVYFLQGELSSDRNIQAVSLSFILVLISTIFGWFFVLDRDTRLIFIKRIMKIQ